MWFVEETRLAFAWARDVDDNSALNAVLSCVLGSMILIQEFAYVVLTQNGTIITSQMMVKNAMVLDSALADMTHTKSLHYNALTTAPANHRAWKADRTERQTLFLPLE